MTEQMKEYYRAFGRKVLENLASVKVWFFVLPFVVSTLIMIWLVGGEFSLIKSSLLLITDNKDLLKDILEQTKTIQDTFISWCTFNVSLVGTIIVVREVFKVSKLKALNEEDSDNSEKIKNINV